MKNTLIIISVMLSVTLISLIWDTCNTAGRIANSVQQTAYDELNAKTLLKKYEWFKDASAALDAKIADLAVYQKKFQTLNEQYNGVPRKDWQRSDIEQYNLWESEMAGLAASYNDLASQYNAEMVKFNWKFCNAGDLPAGATIPLPRNYKPYQTQ